MKKANDLNFGQLYFKTYTDFKHTYKLLVNHVVCLKPVCLHGDVKKILQEFLKVSDEK